MKKSFFPVILTPLKQSARGDFSFSTFDLETNGLGGRFLDGGIYNGKEYFHFDKLQKLVDYMLDNPKLYYAHNGGKYDLAYLIEPIIQRRLKVQTIETGSRVIEARIVTKEGKLLQIRDSFALLPQSLAKLCINFKINHPGLSDKDKRVDMLKFKAENPERYYLYLQGDCQSLHEIITCLFNREKLQGINPHSILTGASLAMQVFRRSFLQGSVSCYAGKSGLMREIRKSYYGGRCEIFEFSDEGASWFDVHSMYASIMETLSCPISEPILGGQKDLERELASGKSFLIDADWKVQSCFIPPLPYRDLETKKVLFPIGQWRGIYWSNEIDWSVCEIQKLHKIYYFSDYKPIFQEYIHYFYELKRQAPKGSPDYELAKICCNGLYGKFGQKEIRENRVYLSENEAIEQIVSGEAKHLKCLGNDLYAGKEQSIHFSAYMIPHIASLITALARKKWRQYALECKRIAYGDTDSFICYSSISENKIPLTDELGDCGIEAELSYFRPILPKIYLATDLQGRIKDKAKGFSCPTRKEIEAGLQQGEKLQSIFSSFAGIGKQIATDGALHKQQYEKRIKACYDKRIVLENGQTEPRRIEK